MDLSPSANMIHYQLLVNGTAVGKPHTSWEAAVVEAYERKLVTETVRDGNRQLVDGACIAPMPKSIVIKREK